MRSAERRVLTSRTDVVPGDRRSARGAAPITSARRSDALYCSDRCGRREREARYRCRSRSAALSAIELAKQWAQSLECGNRVAPTRYKCVGATRSSSLLTASTHARVKPRVGRSALSSVVDHQMSLAPSVIAISGVVAICLDPDVMSILGCDPVCLVHGLRRVLSGLPRKYIHYAIPAPCNPGRCS